MNKRKSTGSDKTNWYRLDNAAKIFPAVVNSERSSVFRISAILQKPINYNYIKKAISSIKDRFPYYNVHLKRGFFWYYLETSESEIIPEPDFLQPNTAFDLKKDKLFRILIYKNRISVEFLHIITDGTGALEFLKTLITSYFEFSDVEEISWENTLNPKNPPQEEEAEDAYNRFFKKNIPVTQTLSRAFHIPFKLNSIPRHRVTNAMMSAKSILSEAKKYNVSLTVYLAALYLFSLQKIAKSNHYKGIIRIQIPVNLRKIYPTKTMRNFALFIMPEIDLRLGEYDFEEITKIVYHHLQLKTDKKLIDKNITRNVRNEKQFIVRMLPLFLKNILLYIFYHIRGTNQYSGVLTNLGKVNLPENISRQIDHLDFTPPPPNKILKINTGVISINDNLVISFGNICKSKQLEQFMLRYLIEKGINVKLIKY
ncbi:hypothetical protein ACFLTE_02665 [Bacteroidota bacterium]